jgi:hypothetical protein
MLAGLGVPVLNEYIDAFRNRDLSRCLALYTEGAILEFGGTYCRDPECIERWHAERFSANLSLSRIDSVAVNGDEVTIDGAVISDRLKTWGVPAIVGRARFIIREGKIAEARFGIA